MEHPFQFMIGELGSLQFYCWLIAALVFWAGIFTMNLMISGAAVLIFSIDIVIIKKIEGVLIHYGVNYPDWLIDSLYPTIPLLVVALVLALLMVSFRVMDLNISKEKASRSALRKLENKKFFKHVNALK